jgi:hypothetical protein
VSSETAPGEGRLTRIQLQPSIREQKANHKSLVCRAAAGKINAAWTSRPSRIARQCPGYRFPTLGGAGARRQVAFSRNAHLRRHPNKRNVPSEHSARIVKGCNRVTHFLDNLLSRPQSPGRRNATESALRNPEPFHPQEFAEAATPPQSTAALETSHACSKFSLRPRRVFRNPQLRCACAETVEDKNWLWKELENREKWRPALADLFELFAEVCKLLVQFLESSAKLCQFALQPIRSIAR